MTSDTSSTYSKFRKTFKENALISADESRISLLSEAEALNKLSERLSKDYERIASGCVIPAAPLNPEDEQPDILTNSAFVEATKEITVHVNTLLKLFREIKMWIKLNVEAVTESETFVFQVQEEVLGTINGIEDAIEGFLTTLTEYHTARAVITSKIHLFPQYENAIHQLKQLDKKSAQDLVASVQSLRDGSYQVIDILQKNEEHLTEKKQ